LIGTTDAATPLSAAWAFEDGTLPARLLPDETALDASEDGR